LDCSISYYTSVGKAIQTVAADIAVSERKVDNLDDFYKHIKLDTILYSEYINANSLLRKEVEKIENAQQRCFKMEDMFNKDRRDDILNNNVNTNLGNLANLKYMKKSLHEEIHYAQKTNRSYPYNVYYKNNECIMEKNTQILSIIDRVLENAKNDQYETDEQIEERNVDIQNIQDKYARCKSIKKVFRNIFSQSGGRGSTACKRQQILVGAKRRTTRK
jgi:hypothetical protein